MEKIEWKNVKEKVLNLLFPKHIKCIFCGEELNELAHNDTCVECQRTLPFIVRPCEKCGGFISASNTGVCDTCKRNKNNYDFTEARCVFIYMDTVVSLVHRFKLENMQYLSEPIGNYLVERLLAWGINVDYVTAVPLHENRKKIRKFNQAKEISLVVSKTCDIPYIDCVKKTVDNKRQATLNMVDRKTNVRDVYKFDAEFKSTVKNKNILLIDDVFTTGATTGEISKIIKKAGAKNVYVLTFAHSIIGDFTDVRDKMKAYYDS